MLHTGSNYKVHSIMEDSSTEAWSAPLMLQTDGPDNPTLERTERDYHLIVAGTFSFFEYIFNISFICVYFIC